MPKVFNLMPETSAGVPLQQFFVKLPKPGGALMANRFARQKTKEKTVQVPGVVPRQLRVCAANFLDGIEATQMIVSEDAIKE